MTDDGQAEEYNAYPRLPLLPSVVSIALANRNTTEAEFAVKEYHTSSLLSVVVQEGSGRDGVAPVVFTATVLLQLAPKG